MKDKTQIITSYISGAGIKVYEIQQYDKASKSWYIVGDCTENKDYLMTKIKLHNEKLK